MRALLLAIAAVCVFAAPAAAQLRDPFAPAIAPPGTTTTTSTGTATTGGEAPLQPAPTTDALANTGADVQGWVVVAFGVISIGIGALYMFKLYERPLT